MKKVKFRSFIAFISIILMVNFSFIYQPVQAQPSDKVFVHLPDGNETIKSVQLYYKEAAEGATLSTNVPMKNPQNYSLYEHSMSEAARIAKEDVQYIKVILADGSELLYNPASKYASAQGNGALNFTNLKLNSPDQTNLAEKPPMNPVPEENSSVEESVKEKKPTEPIPEEEPDETIPFKGDKPVKEGTSVKPGTEENTPEPNPYNKEKPVEPKDKEQTPKPKNENKEKPVEPKDKKQTLKLKNENKEKPVEPKDKNKRPKLKNENKEKSVEPKDKKQTPKLKNENKEKPVEPKDKKQTPKLKTENKEIPEKVKKEKKVSGQVTDEKSKNEQSIPKLENDNINPGENKAEKRLSNEESSHKASKVNQSEDKTGPEILTVQKGETINGGQLPDTASPWANILMIGALFGILSALTLFKLRRS